MSKKNLNLGDDEANLRHAANQESKAANMCAGACLTSAVGGIAASLASGPAGLAEQEVVQPVSGSCTLHTRLCTSSLMRLKTSC